MASKDLKSPNIVFILSDDQGAWTLGATGNKEIKTPNLDRLAKEGMLFSNFFCSSPVCSPARASIITGRIPSQHGVHDWIVSGNVDFDILDEEIKANKDFENECKPIEFLKDQLAYTDVLAQNGYQCMLSGKWHLGDSLKPQKSFSKWFTIARGGCHYYNSDVVRDGKVKIEKEYISDSITNEAIKYLDESNGDDKPFYISVHYTAPHSPWDEEECPKDVYDMYRDCEFKDVPNLELHPWQSWGIWEPKEGQSQEDRRRELLRGYYSSITAMDRGIGKIIDKLDELGMRENTLVIFTADNGMNMGHHGVWGKGNGTFPLNMYDSSVKIPMIISRPSSIKKGIVCDELLSHYDIMPTLLDYLNIQSDVTKCLPGISFAPLLKEKNMLNRDKVVVFDEYGPVRMIRTKEWKYVHRYPYGPHELYDLVNDPGESINLIEDENYTEVLESLRGKLEDWFFEYVNPEIDGTREAVTGNGQANLAGIRKKGRKAFN